MARTTKTERLEQARLARERDEVDAFKARVARMRAMVVVRSAEDLLHGERTLADDTTYLLYEVLTELKDAQDRLARDFESLRDECRRAEASHAERRYYSTPAIQGRGLEVNASHARLHGITTVGRRLAQHLGVFVPDLWPAWDAEGREATLRYGVRRVATLDGTQGWWTVCDADGAFPPALAAANAHASFETEDAAWIAFKMLVDSGDISRKE